MALMARLKALEMTDEVTAGGVNVELAAILRRAAQSEDTEQDADRVQQMGLTAADVKPDLEVVVRYCGLRGRADRDAEASRQRRTCWGDFEIIRVAWPEDKPAPKRYAPGPPARSADDAIAVEYKDLCEMSVKALEADFALLQRAAQFPKSPEHREAIRDQIHAVVQRLDSLRVPKSRSLGPTASSHLAAAGRGG